RSEGYSEGDSPVMDRAFLRLIAITDNVRDGQAGLIARAVAAAEGGATSIQLRLKDVAAHDLVLIAQELVKAVAVPVIVNDRADVAIAAGAAGVHLGPDDLPVKAVRSFAPPGFIIGTSVGLDEEISNAEGADYVGVGPIFQTVSKTDAGAAIGIAEFSRLAVATGLPAVGIGGISAENARLVIDGGAAGVAVIAAVFGVTDPRSAAKLLASAIGT
ncbi:MAG: thiamine phosphate synthase, partial [Gemmatimonadales bacterium]